MTVLYLFLVTAVLFSFGEIGRISVGQSIFLHSTDLSIFVCVLFWSIRKIRERVFIQQLKSAFTKPFFLFMAIGFLSLLINSYRLTQSEFVVSLLYLIRWIFYSFLFYLVRSFDANSKRKIFIALLFSGCLLLFFGLLQYFLYPNLKNLYYLGWDDHLYRLFSTLFDPNFTATIISLLLFALITIFLHYSFKKTWQTYSILVLSLLSFIALLLTYSRSGFLMFVVGCSVVLLLSNKKKYIVGVFITMLLGILLIPKDLGSAGVELWRTASIHARTDAAQQALAIIIDNPVIGVGFNTYRYVQKDYGFADGTNWRESHSGAGTDNSFLFVLATTGVIGFVAFLNFWRVIANNTYNKYKGYKSYTLQKIYAVICLASMGGLFVNTFFINSLFYPYSLFWIIVLLGLVEKET